MNDAVAIVSGGMDSVTMLYYMVKVLKLHPIVATFLYGQKHSKETEYAKYHAEFLGCDTVKIDLSSVSLLFDSSALVGKMDVPNINDVTGDPQPVTYVPNRNMILLAVAAALAENAGVTAVYYGAQAHDMYGYWDTTVEFVDRINSVCELNRKGAVKIFAPFISKSKGDVLQIGIDLDVDYSKTWSCYNGRELACGTCPTCAERLNAFTSLGLIDPIKYE